MMPPRQHFPRIIDIIASASGLLLLSPLLIVVGLLVRLTSPGPALHRARRVGRGGVEFTLYKFRSMRPDAATGSGITHAGDMRITAIGRWVRATKIDELPQLVNVLRGDMSLVGPRPEDPRYVRHYPVDLRPILHLTPGITSAASLVYANESALLAGADHERVYVEKILPDKLRIDLEWFTHASTLDNIGLIMRTVFRRPPATLALALLIVLVALPTGLDAQTVMLPLRHPAYEFLDRMEARYGTALLQFQRPLPRMEIARAIDALGRSTAALTTYDRQQIEFYRAEFSEELLRLHEADSTVSVSEDERWNLLRIRSTTPARSFLAVDFVARAGLQKREDADDVFQRSSGIQAWGYVGSSLGAFMRWYDNGRTGVPYDPFAFRTPEQGIVRGPQSSPTSYEFEVTEAQFWYSNPWLVAGVQKGDVWLGSGRDGGIIFSDKAPSVPMVNYRIMITDWLAFEYFHAWLFSDILDTARTWVGQKFHETKYMASHSVTARPLPNLQATLGESIVYGGGDVNFLFLIPVISFRAADRWARFTTGNAQFFADVRYTPLPGVTTYAMGLIDEMDMGKALTGDRTNFDYHVAYTVGALFTDLHFALVPLASETRIEFTRVYPYVYSNPNPTQQYTSHQVLLGHWIGANADLLTVQHVIHPARWLDAGITASFGRFADPHPAPLVTPRVQPAFLSKPQAGVRMLRANLRWTPLHDLWVKLDIAYTKLERKTVYSGGPWVPGTTAGITVSYGLY